MNSFKLLPHENRNSSGWKAIPESEIKAWNNVLLHSDGSVLQYPYWNEPYRRVGVEPVYLTWDQEGTPVAYICILTLRFAGIKMGLAMRGPFALDANRTIPPEALSDLYRWASANGYIFIRFTHSDSALLRRLEHSGPSRRLDSFPFHLDRSAALHDLVIVQAQDDNAMLAEFDREARRKIKRAIELKYQLRTGSSPAELAEVWPVFLNFFERKGIYFNLPLEGFLDAARLAVPHDCFRVYSAWLDQKPIEALIVFRDHSTALCQFAALDVDALGGKSSPSVLLHWFAMRDMYRMGAKYYNLGPGTGSLLQFKRQFHPFCVTYPPPVTAVLNKPLYFAWSAMVLPLARVLKPCAVWMLRLLHPNRAKASEIQGKAPGPAGLRLVPGGRS